jgi:hypothetical protein
MSPLRPWEVIVLKRPLAWRLFGAWATLFPLVMLRAVVLKGKSGELWEALSILLFTAVLSGLGVWFWAFAGAKILVTARGLERTGLRPVKMTWEELDSIEFRFGDVRFQTKDGRRIVVNRMSRDCIILMRVLPNQVRSELKSVAERAVQHLARPGDEL